jgi:hypothetical protein
VKTPPPILLVLAGLALNSGPVQAQDPNLEAAETVAEIQVQPAGPAVSLGETVEIRLVALDEGGGEVPGVQYRVFGRGVEVAPGDDPSRWSLTGSEGGEGLLVATVVTPADFQGETVRVVTPVTVHWPAIDRVDIGAREPGTLYAGTALRYEALAYHADGSLRPDPALGWSTSDPEVATVDDRGQVVAHGPGAVTLEVEADGARGTLELRIPPFPAEDLSIEGGNGPVLQGEVVHLDAVARDPGGTRVDDLPVVWSTHYLPDDSIRAPGAAGIVRDGRFVGEGPGTYTVVASAGSLVARTRVDVRPRRAIREVEPLGQGSVSHVHTSDLWVYEGNDGRDYAVTGTWGGDGWAYFWDVTDPANPMKTDSLQVDARTVNDVKVSPDGRYAALSREGASNRRNGVVILDLADPAHPVVASTYDEGLTGGVHNMFATEDHLFALSAGDKYVILDMADLAAPRYVSEYDHPDSRIHDVWVHDGIAYSSEWENGVVVVDVGNGRWGGTIENPVFVTNVPYPVGRTHAAFPYVQEETGKVYLFLGDEILNREGAAWSGAGLGRIPEKGGTPSVTSGYIHIIDFTDPENPEDVARYEVPEFGTHNLWVEDDILYVAYYEGGVRAVDVTGELLGNLATQGREIAVWKAFDPQGFAPNAPMAWGPQPHKGHLFFSDFNSGLWSIRILPEERPIS